ncbi:MAG: ABC transporter permease subunit [Planctomycetota bacterium]
MIGPVFSREAVTAPRRPSFYATRSLFVAGLLVIVLTAWQVLVGSRDIRNPGDLARFGEAVFALIAPLVLTVCVLFSALFAAASVAQEKDRKTLLLLLLSDLTNRELVLGKLLASMLTVLVVIAATAPLLMMLTLLGGVSHVQVLRVLAVTLVGSLVAGSIGSTLALWREKTFQALAMTALVLVLWLVAFEIVHAGVLGQKLLGLPATDLATAASPWRAVQAALEPSYALPASAVIDAPGAAAGPTATTLVSRFLLVGAGLVAVLNGVAIARVRVWNPSQEARPQTGADEPPVTTAAAANANANDEAPGAAARPSVHNAPGRVRRVWDNPILWREVRTWAYGRKILLIKVAYLAIFAIAAAGALSATASAPRGRSIIPPAAGPLAPMLAVSVVLVGALSVTSLTNERDAKALDLLLTTDLTPRELIFGKLGGVAYNAREMILLPMLLCGYLWWSGSLTGENLAFLVVGLLVVNAFAAMLGLHAGMMYPNSRHAIAASLGTLLFLFLGITTCMRMMLALSDSFNSQLVPFLGFMLGGGVGLFAVLGWRNPSSAILLASFAAPITTFYAITSFLLGQYGAVFAATIATFGFATTAMLVPALAEFDVATGRTAAKGE